MHTLSKIYCSTFQVYMSVYGTLYPHTLLARLISAPFLISIFTTSLYPYWLAMNSGVAPSYVRGIIKHVEMNVATIMAYTRNTLIFKRELLCTCVVIQCACLYLHTLWARLMSAPFLTSIVTTLLCPFSLAMYRGVVPSCERNHVTTNMEHVSFTMYSFK